MKTVAVREDGCFSVLLWEGRPFALGLERTFEDGRPVIGAGTYQCTKSTFYRGGYPTYEIAVPGHSRILFHKGNVETDSDGCVLVAESFGELRGATAVLNSAGGFKELMQLAGDRPTFELVVEGR